METIFESTTHKPVDGCETTPFGGGGVEIIWAGRAQWGFHGTPVDGCKLSDPGASRTTVSETMGRKP